MPDTLVQSRDDPVLLRLPPADRRDTAPAGSEADPWSALDPFTVDRARLLRHRVVALAREHPAATIFDLMRTKLLRLARDKGWATVGVTSPTRRAGTTAVTLNLALSLSHQIDCCTVLLDLNLRAPGLRAVLGTPAARDLTDVLCRGGRIETALVRLGGNVAVGAVVRPIASAAEVLQAASTARRLEEIRATLEPDLVLVDAPPMLERDDFHAAVPLLDAVLIVADVGHTTLHDIDACEREASELTSVAGVVLNRCGFR